MYYLISFHWDNTQKALTISDRKGEFPGMLKNRTFHMVFVTENKGIGVGTTETPAKTITYVGTKVIQKL